MKIKPINKYSYQVYPQTDDMIEVSEDDIKKIKAGELRFSDDLKRVIQTTKEDIEYKENSKLFMQTFSQAFSLYEEYSKKIAELNETIVSYYENKATYQDFCNAKVLREQYIAKLDEQKEFLTNVEFDCEACNI